MESDRQAGPGRPARRGLARPLLFFLASLIVFILVMMLKLNIHNRILDVGYRISQENSTKRALLQEMKQMNLEVQYLRSPERINDLAQTQFSMRIPGSSQIIHLKTGRKSKP